ncbi:MAG: hypothetical protein FWE34_05370 [Defluviitaleaceae bacterium]|nr:hypothetical protein [Defluviitaleaceae bacterium]
MKQIILYIMLSFSALAFTACDELEFDNISANIDLTGDPTEIAYHAYSALLESLHFANIREGAVGLDYHIEFYGEMLSVNAPMIFEGGISTSYKDRMLGFNITMQLYGDDHIMFLHILAEDGEIIFADADEEGALMIYMAVGEAMYDLLWGSSHIPFVHLPQADIDSFNNVHFVLDGDYLTIHFTLTNAIVYPNMLVDAEISLVLQSGLIPSSISIDMTEVSNSEHLWQQRIILDYIFHYFTDNVVFINNDLRR